MKKTIKKFSKIMSILLAVVMVMIMALPGGVKADQRATETITINNPKAGHTYTAYQIFTGTLTSNENSTRGVTEYILSDIEWGNGVDSAKFLEALVGATWVNGVSFNASMDAAAVAVPLEGDQFVADGPNSLQFAKLAVENKKGDGYPLTYNGNNYTVTVPAGYYVIIDSVSGDNKDDAVSSYIMRVTDSVTIEPKSSIPSIDKKVSKSNITNATESASAAKYASAAVGDAVYFQLTATLPDNFDSYESYKLVFHDTMAKGFSYVNGSTHTYLVNGDDWKELPISGNIEGTITTGEETTLIYTIKDVKSINKDKDNNDVTVTAPTDTTEGSKIVIVYSATLNTYAVTGNGSTAGVYGNTNEVYLTYANNPNDTNSTGDSTPSTAVVYTYKLNVTKTDNDGGALTGAEFTLYKASSVSEDGKAITWETTGEAFTVDAAGNGFSISGLDEGTYKIVETIAPSGFNKADDLVITIRPEFNNGVLSGLKATDPDAMLHLTTFTSDVNEGSLSTTIINQRGTILPTTGGIGTTIFYIVGSILVLGAVILLIAKKRMNTNKN